MRVMATESDWYRTAEEAEEKPQVYADKLNGSEAPAIETEQSTDDLIGISSLHIQSYAGWKILF